MYVNYDQLHDPRDKRLALEHEKLDNFCRESTTISYEAITRRGGLPPEEYYFFYKIRSIIGINPDQSPIYGYYHSAKIVIPVEFPLGGQPECSMVTPIWHPNIKSEGTFAGRICANFDGFGGWQTLVMIADMIGEMLQFKQYNADTSRPPYPEDPKVALWIREYAEPRSIIGNGRKKAVQLDKTRIRVKKSKGIRVRNRSQKIKNSTIKIIKKGNQNKT